MCKLVNSNKNIFIDITPISCNDFGFMFNLNLKTDILYLDFKKVTETNRYMSYENINHIKKHLVKIENIENFSEEELIASIYPIDMFFTMDIFKSNKYFLFLKLRFPIGVYTNSKTTGYDFGLDFSVEKDDFILFLRDLIDSCEKLKNINYS